MTEPMTREELISELARFQSLYQAAQQQLLEPAAWMVLTKNWPQVQDEEVRYVPHVSGMTMKEGWTPLFFSTALPRTPNT